VDYDRPHLYYDDACLPSNLRVGPETFGTHDGIAYGVGHMVPNEATNRQFGRLAQMETFFMSNMSPQYRTLNQGLWKKLEDEIHSIEDAPGKDHIWAIVGPVFSSGPTYIDRLNGTRMPAPESYYCITVDCFWLLDGNAEWSTRKKVNGVNGYVNYAEKAKSLELTAGGYWSYFKDWPHVQMRKESNPRHIFRLQEINKEMANRFGN
jgi:uncharacterized protein (UPF0297 family)